VTDLAEPSGIVALAAAAGALAALVLILVLTVRLRRLRAAQSAVLGPTGREDLVAHASGLHQAFDALHERVEEIAARLEERMAAAEARLDGAIAYRALLHYDAYGELSGRQSSSLALLDAHGDGVVLSCITHRDTARLYCKLVHNGRGEHQLSPEEDEAIRLALAGETSSAPLE
jgi:hypothetical protein